MMVITPADKQTLLQHALAKYQHLSEVDPEVRDARPLVSQTRELIKQCSSSIEALALVCATYAPRAVMGSRATAQADTVDRLPKLAAEFTTLTYGELWNSVKALASGWLQSDNPMVQPGNHVGILGFASPQYVIADLACLYLNATASSLATDLRSEDFIHLVNEGEFTGLVATWETLDSILAAMDACPTIKGITVIDFPVHDPRAHQELQNIERRFASAGRTLTVAHVGEIEDLGIRRGIVPFVVPAAGTDPLRMLCYTSGSTGSPKGAIYNESLMFNYWRGACSEIIPEFPLISVNFTPLNHMMGRLGYLRVLSAGGTIYFTPRSDMSTLFDDMRLVRPTKLDLVPRVAEMIYQHYQTELAVRSRGIQDEDAISDQIMAEMRNNYLGDRLLWASIGSAPTSQEVKRFLTTCFDIPLIEGYGMTECGAITIDDKVQRQMVSSYKLVDAPELGYRNSDKPYPRGILYVKTDRAVPGYYKNPAATMGLFDEEGFLKTGDIFEEQGPDHLVYVDRANNVLKLSQGEFVTVSRLESIFEHASPFFQQVYLYGNSSRSYLVGVIVVARDYVTSLCTLQGKEPNEEAIYQLCKQELSRIAKEADLRAYEIPRDFLLETVPFSTENGLLTSVKKNARPALKRKYVEQLEALYLRIERSQLATLAEFAAKGRKFSAQELVESALTVTLGGAKVDATSSHSFADMGVDSLAAMTFTASLQQIGGVAMEASFVLSPATTLLDIVKKVEEQLTGSDNDEEISYASIHDGSGQIIRAEELQIDRFLSAAELDAAMHLSKSGNFSNPRNFLLTGATGWLGRFLCLEMLERAAQNGGKIYALVRAADDAGAAERLTAVFDTDPTLKERVTRLARAHLIVYAGDLALPRFGLTPERYAHMAADVDAVMHPGALVNHVYPYRQLFRPNVMGTVEVIRFALTKKLKAIHYVSTIGVVGGSAHDGVIRESEDVRTLVPSWTMNQHHYAQGYAISKWAGEVLLRNLSERISLPINVFRPTMIMPHTKYRGQINVHDMFTRLLASLIYTGIAPRSFYQSAEAGEKPHYDGLPGDLIARTMVNIAMQQSSVNFNTYHVRNPNADDGISLDTFVSWIRSAGYRLTTIADHSQWFKQFEQRLATLDEERKGFSALAILSMWSRPAPVSGSMVADATEFRAQVEALGSPIPQLTEGFLHKYLNDMQYLGMITLPSQELPLNELVIGTGNVGTQMPEL